MPVVQTAERPFSLLVKPIGAICDLDCAYCFYLDKRELYPQTRDFRMSADTLEAVIRQYIAAQPPGTREIQFAWQGGEPTLMGLAFFEQAVALQRRHAPAGVTIRNALQTHGMHLDEAWCRLLREQRFLVGLSCDGPADLHDAHRVDRRGRPTHDAVMKTLRRLKKHAVDVNLLVVVNRHNGDEPERVYKFLKDRGVDFVQFIPLVEWETRDGRPAVSDRSVGPAQWGRFLIGVFEAWRRHDVGRVFVQTFDQALAGWVGVQPAMCTQRATCGDALVCEHNGDIYCCDHFVTPAHKLGNVHDTPLVELVGAPRLRTFGREKFTGLPPECLSCDVRFACHGECPKNRWPTGGEGQTAGLNYLCEGFKAFYRHIDPTMRDMAAALRTGRPAVDAVGRSQ